MRTPNNKQIQNYQLFHAFPSPAIGALNGREREIPLFAVQPEQVQRVPRVTDKHLVAPGGTEGHTGYPSSHTTETTAPLFIFFAFTGNMTSL